ncbi:amino acid adenylation domain-containing protein [Pigmentibacter sp. JX0631]|uniref:amino acid adenylation domain-containing protein n=1 Tax=Pigmentibacter sp. JX0631 TaxID=2976982 RepID=UPI0024698E1B|nr:amino acid adenylation domain-containing protein [Pigmentibacter sp. JX0631]WGL58749.1 amino acid adenylation domain-containing protein [Pigmentibacter sp. JX0631]
MQKINSQLEGENLYIINRIIENNLNFEESKFENSHKEILNKKNIFSKLLINCVRYSEKNAVTYNDVNYTYEDFLKYILNIKRRLNKIISSNKQIIAVYLENPLDIITSIWGIISFGSSYLPLSIEYPDNRIKYMLENSNVTNIITSKKLSKKIGSLVNSVENIILSESFSDNFAEKFEINHLLEPNNIKSEDLCYVIYTSGSTGNPKGVMINHENILNQMDWLEKNQSINSNSIILQKTPISFDAAQWEILSLACGSQVVLTDSYSYMDPAKIISYINKHKINTLQCVPTLLQGLLDTKELKSCNTLKHLFVGGEALNKSLISKASKEIQFCNFINLYGPTECTINSSALNINIKKLDTYENIISIGKPISNMYYYVLDKNLEITPIGEIGELYIAGKGVGQGYLNNLMTTNERFLSNPFSMTKDDKILYKTGDLVRLIDDGSYLYCGRADNQIKLRGYRIELDEIKATIEMNQWIKHAAVIVKNEKQYNSDYLIAFIELNTNEAVLMDQGKFSPHHISKENKHQVLMQLAENGIHSKNDLELKSAYSLNYKTPTEEMMQFTFSRKSYRYFDGNILNNESIFKLISDFQTAKNSVKKFISDLSFDNFSEILRYFGKYKSSERLLPKYSYASPGALYATQMYLECNNLSFINNGCYYYHPVDHKLFNFCNIHSGKENYLKIHFIGKKSAIENVYQLNVSEVLEFETGHILGVFDKILPKFGLEITNTEYDPNILNTLNLNTDYIYLGSYQVTSNNNLDKFKDIEVYFQNQNNYFKQLETGLYEIKQNKLNKVSSDYVLENEVIAINQIVYQRSQFGISLINKKSSWHQYIDLGRYLQHLQMNDINIGLMSSGYSSKSGHSLPTALKLEKILGLSKESASYFCLGGSISLEQKKDMGMKEDSVHMQGPIEIILEDLKKKLPNFMIPNKIVTLEKIPLTANGKIDTEYLKTIDIDIKSTSIIKPRSDLEEIIYQIWIDELKIKEFSVTDNFFLLGGNSITIIKILKRLKNEFNIDIPIQSFFEYKSIDKLTEFIKSRNIKTLNRIINLNEKEENESIFCWPGLGGFCLNLKNLSKSIKSECTFYGIQSYGLNENEKPYNSIEEMSKKDLELIKKIKPTGPYKLWGYSFGAQLAYETCYLLESLGEEVSEVVLIAPGMPSIKNSVLDSNTLGEIASFKNKKFIAILFSVFFGKVNTPLLEICINNCYNEELFINFILTNNNAFDYQMAKRIVELVKSTYNFISTNKLTNKIIKAPIKIFLTQGDNISNFERDLLHLKDNIIIKNIPLDHYSILQEENFNF